MTLHETGIARRQPGVRVARPRAPSGQRRRANEIVDAAARVFAERGYHGTTTQDIADTLGMRQASLYYYFSSKEAALEQVCEHGVAGFVAAASNIAGTDEPAHLKIERLIAAHLEPTESHRDYVRVFINERRYLPAAIRKRIGRASRRVERLMQDVLEAGISDGSFRVDIDARLCALAILGMCNAVINWRPGEPRSAVAIVAPEFARLVVGGLRQIAPDVLRPVVTLPTPKPRRRARG